jgi:hypothetical protein
MTERIFRLCVLGVILFFGLRVFAHSHLKANASFTPRSNDAGLKAGPCGGLARSANPTVLQAGSTVTVDWEETINHPGHFELSISTGDDQNFQLVKSIPDTQDGNADLPHENSTTVVLPSQNCDNCTLQLIQVMTENPAMPTNYYSCADFKIVNGTAAQAASPAPAPTPAPAANCN